MSDLRPGHLTVRPMSAKLTRNTEFFGSMDPYCIVSLGECKQRTRVADSAGKYPHWQDQFIFRRTTEEQLFFAVWDKDTVSADDLVGEGSMLLRNAFQAVGVWDGWIDLAYRGRKAGSLRCQISWAPDQAGIPTQQRASKHAMPPPPNYTFTTLPPSNYPSMPPPPNYSHASTMPPPPQYNQPPQYSQPPQYTQPPQYNQPPQFGYQSGTMPPPPQYSQSMPPQYSPPATMPPPPQYSQQATPPGYAPQAHGMPSSYPPPPEAHYNAQGNYAQPPYQMPGTFFNPYSQPPPGYPPTAPPNAYPPQYY